MRQYLNDSINSFIYSFIYRRECFEKPLQQTQVFVDEGWNSLIYFTDYSVSHRLVFLFALGYEFHRSF